MANCFTQSPDYCQHVLPSNIQKPPSEGIVKLNVDATVYGDLSVKKKQISHGFDIHQNKEEHKKKNHMLKPYVLPTQDLNMINHQR